MSAPSAFPVPPAVTAKRRGRPKGHQIPRIKTFKLDINEGVSAFADLASKKPSPNWEWEGKSYPKTKRSHGPNQGSLNEHSELLEILFKLAPNGYPDAYRLRDVLVKLHMLFHIFADDDSQESQLSIGNRAMLAADRIRIMAKHCLMLYKSNSTIQGDGLKAVIRLITPGAEAPAEPAVTAQPATPSALEETQEDGQGQILETPPEEEPKWWNEPIPYLANGVVDWACMEDHLPVPEEDEEFFCEVAALDASLPQPSNLHPYYHRFGVSDCFITSHKCGCPKCRLVVIDSDPPQKKPE